MKKILLKILKWTGISLLVLIVLLILVPIIFKDQIKEMVIDEVNKSLTAELSIKDFDLTFISTFPNMTIEIHDAKLSGLNEFEGVDLMSMKKLTAHVGFWSVVAGDQVEVDEIHVDQAVIDVRILENGLANYDIVKPDSVKTEAEIEEPSNFKLSLKEYSINDAKIKYNDHASDMYAELDNVNHTGKGDLTADVIDFETTTKMDKLSYRMDGISYLTEVETDAIVNILMTFTDKSSRFELKENSIQLNKVNLSVDGFYEMFDGYDDMDLKLDASKSTFKDFLSLIPAFYHTGYENMVSSGSLKLDGEVKGKMNETDLPGWDFNLKVNNGSIKYADLPGKIRNIQINAGSTFEGGENLDKMKVDISRFHAELSKNKLDATLILRRMMSNPYIESGLHTHFDLSTLREFIPVTEGESYSGILNADVDVKGTMMDLENEDYEKFRAEGVLELSEMNYKTPTLTEDVNINQMKFTFAPEKLEVNEMNAKMGKSDFAVDGKIENFFGYMLRDSELKGDFNFSSNYLDLDEIMGVYPEEETNTRAAKAASTSEKVVPQESSPTLVPGNIDFNLNSNINTVKYNGIKATDVSGNVRIHDEEATLSDITLNAMGGKIGLDGSYNTQDHENPAFNFGYNLKDINIQELTSNFLTVGKLAPIAKFAQGKISSNFAMNSVLDNDLMPVLNSISSDGDVSSNKLAVSGFELLEKIEKVTKLKNISKQTFNNFKTHFAIHDGKLMLTPFDLKMAGINTKVSGYTTLEKEMNYKFAMKIPKDKIPASVLKEVENGLTLLNGLHPKISLGDLPAYIPANVFATGDIKNPKITTDLKEQVKLAVKDKIGNVVDDIKETVKDSIQNVIDEQVDDIKEQIEEQKRKILEDAQKQADKVIAHGKEAADKVRKEADNHAEQLIKEAGSNPIKKKLAEAAAKKYKEEAYKKADKIEAEAKAKADDIMRKAREQADKLG